MNRIEKPQERDKIPAVTVVVVNYNGGGYLSACLDSLAHQTFRDFEVIVVDNASTDNSLDLIADNPEPTTILKQSKNLGFAAGNNVGVKAGKGRWIALLNPDAEADPSWLAALMGAVERRPDMRMAASLQIDQADPSRLDGAGDNYLIWGFAWRGGFGHDRAEAPTAGQCFAPCAAAALYPRDAWDAAGGMDERYFCYHEDVDLGFRMRLQGEICQFVPDAVVKHAGSAISGRTSEFSIFHGSRNSVWTYVKNMPLALLVLTFPVFVTGIAMLLVRSLATGRFRPTVRGYAAAVGGISPFLAERRLNRDRVKVSIGELALSMAWNPLKFIGRQIVIRRTQRPPGD